jgi:hypothetical protein
VGYWRLVPILKPLVGQNEYTNFERKAILNGDPMGVSEVSMHGFCGPSHCLIKWATNLAPIHAKDGIRQAISHYLSLIPQVSVNDADLIHTKIRLAAYHAFRVGFWLIEDSSMIMMTEACGAIPRN